MRTRPLNNKAMWVLLVVLILAFARGTRVARQRVTDDIVHFSRRGGRG